jgi:predicted transcriptional regulator
MFKRDFVAQEMIRQGRSKKWAGKELDVNAETIGRYLSGKIPCPKPTAIAWAIFMNLEPMAFWESDKSLSRLAA